MSGCTQGTIDRHLEDTTLAQEIAHRHAKLQAVATTDSAGASTDSAGASTPASTFKAIELGCAKLLTSALSPRESRACCALLEECLATALHQDLFRLRRGTRLLVEHETCKAWLSAMRARPTPKNADKNTANPKTADTKNADTVSVVDDAAATACVSAALRLMCAAARDNEVGVAIFKKYTYVL